MRATPALLMMLAVGAAAPGAAQDEAADPPSDRPPSAEEARAERERIQREARPRTPESFQPSEEISEDLSVAFPADI